MHNSKSNKFKRVVTKCDSIDFETKKCLKNITFAESKACCKRIETKLRHINNEWKC